MRRSKEIKSKDVSKGNAEEIKCEPTRWTVPVPSSFTFMLDEPAKRDETKIKLFQIRNLSKTQLDMNRYIVFERMIYSTYSYTQSTQWAGFQDRKEQACLKAPNL